MCVVACVVYVACALLRVLCMSYVLQHVVEITPITQHIEQKHSTQYRKLPQQHQSKYRFQEHPQTHNKTTPTYTTKDHIIPPNTTTQHEKKTTTHQSRTTQNRKRTIPVPRKTENIPKTTERTTKQTCQLVNHKRTCFHNRTTSHPNVVPTCHS